MDFYKKIKIMNNCRKKQHTFDLFGPSSINKDLYIGLMLFSAFLFLSFSWNKPMAILSYQKRNVFQLKSFIGNKIILQMMARFPFPNEFQFLLDIQNKNALKKSIIMSKNFDFVDNIVKTRAIKFIISI